MALASEGRCPSLGMVRPRRTGLACHFPDHHLASSLKLPRGILNGPSWLYTPLFRGELKRNCSILLDLWPQLGRAHHTQLIRSLSKCSNCMGFRRPSRGQDPSPAQDPDREAQGLRRSRSAAAVPGEAHGEPAIRGQEGGGYHKSVWAPWPCLFLPKSWNQLLNYFGFEA